MAYDLVRLLPSYMEVLIMSENPRRRFVLKSIASASAVELSAVSVVVADKDSNNNRSDNKRHPVALPDLRIRTYASESRELSIEIEHDQSPNSILEKNITVPSAENQDSSIDYNFRIKNGNFKALIKIENEKVADLMLSSPIGGYPRHRGINIDIKESETEVYEQVS